MTPQQIKIDPPPSPNSPIWQKELQAIQINQAKVGEKEMNIIHFWKHDRDSESGDWRTIVNDYLFENLEPLPKMCLVRSLVTMGISNSIIITQQAKNAYNIKRPFEANERIKLLTKAPQHQSYPSTHATIAAAMATILSTFFPEETKKWEELAVEGSLSRIWAGVHYPLDKKEGEKIGLQIGERLIEPFQPE